MSTVSFSETQTFLKCDRAHYYGYVRGLERVQASDSLAAGKALHSALESYYGHVLAAGGDTLAGQRAVHREAADVALAKWELVQPEPMEKRADLTATLDLYFAGLEPFVLGGYRVLAVEREFNLLYSDDGGQYPFVVDLLVEDPKGEVVVVDHKSAYDFYSGNDEHLMPQLPLYIGALRGLGFPAHYGAYNLFRTRKIKAPTPEQMHKLVLPIRPTTTRITTTFLEQVRVAREVTHRRMLSLEEADARAFRTANKMVCQSCAFQELCISDLNGDNSALVERTQYKKRERRTFSAITEEVS